MKDIHHPEGLIRTIIRTMHRQKTPVEVQKMGQQVLVHAFRQRESLKKAYRAHIGNDLPDVWTTPNHQDIIKDLSPKRNLHHTLLCENPTWRLLLELFCPVPGVVFPGSMFSLPAPSLPTRTLDPPARQQHPSALTRYRPAVMTPLPAVDVQAEHPGWDVLTPESDEEDEIDDTMEESMPIPSSSRLGNEPAPSPAGAQEVEKQWTQPTNQIKTGLRDVVEATISDFGDMLDVDEVTFLQRFGAASQNLTISDLKELAIIAEKMVLLFPSFSLVLTVINLCRQLITFMKVAL